MAATVAISLFLRLPHCCVYAERAGFRRCRSESARRPSSPVFIALLTGQRHGTGDPYPSSLLGGSHWAGNLKAAGTRGCLGVPAAVSIIGCAAGAGGQDTAFSGRRAGAAQRGVDASILFKPVRQRRTKEAAVTGRPASCSTYCPIAAALACISAGISDENSQPAIRFH